ncbi:MAG TPA: hydrogenase maturation protease [Myxococcaceae bacterium]|nr:hydrogenase maturation protease [Myxococcaceae bacterium]
MSTRARVVGIGQRVAGDDGVGLAVLDELRRRSVPEGTELIHLADPMDLVSLLESGDRAVLVDAVLGSTPGRVVELGPEELSRQAPLPASSHGLGAARAIQLAGALSPGGAASRLRVVAVTIHAPDRYRVGLSPEVAAAVPQAADHVLRLLGSRPR